MTVTKLRFVLKLKVYIMKGTAYIANDVDDAKILTPN